MLTRVNRKLTVNNLARNKDKFLNGYRRWSQWDNCPELRQKHIPGRQTDRHPTEITYTATSWVVKYPV